MQPAHAPKRSSCPTQRSKSGMWPQWLSGFRVLCGWETNAVSTRAQNVKLPYPAKPIWDVATMIVKIQSAAWSLQLHNNDPSPPVTSNSFHPTPPLSFSHLELAPTPQQRPQPSPNIDASTINLMEDPLN